MKSPKELVEDLKATVEALAVYAQQDPTKHGVIIIALADRQLTGIVAGAPATLSELVAHAMNEDKNVDQIISRAAEAAPLMGMLDALKAAVSEDRDEVCNCVFCKARRAAKTTVN